MLAHWHTEFFLVVNLTVELHGGLLSGHDIRWCSSNTARTFETKFDSSVVTARILIGVWTKFENQFSKYSFWAP